MIDVTCPECQVELEVPSSKAGTRVACPECDHRFVVPAAKAPKLSRPTPSKPTKAIKTEPSRGPEASSARPPTGPKKGKRPAPRRDEDEDEEEDDSGKKLRLILGLSLGGVVVVALIAGGLFFALRDRGNKEVAQAPAPVNPPPVFQPVVRPPVMSQPVVQPPTSVAAPKTTPKDTGTPIATGGPASASESGLYGHVLSSTVWLVVPVSKTSIAFGTGSLVDKKNRLILTNFHVVGNAAEILVLFPIQEAGRLVQNRDTYLEILNTKRDTVMKGRVVAKDAKHDLALVQLPQVPEGALPLSLADKDVEPGQSVHSLGNPGSGGMLWVYAPGKVRSVSLKHTWQVKAGEGPKDVMTIESDVIMTDSPTNPGDSGGPLVNDHAELVGVTHGGDPNSRGVSLFINRSEVVRFVQDHCTNNGLAWDKSDRKLQGSIGGPTESDLPALVKDLSSSEPSVRSRAAQLLGTLGPKAKLAVSDLARLLKDSEPLPRRCALEALGKIGPEASPAADTLLELLKGTDATYRQEAARALGKIGPGVKSQAFPALAAALKDPNKAVRLAAAEAITSLGPLDPVDLPVVLEWIKLTEADLRAPAARALGQFPTTQGKEVVPALVAAYNAGDDKQVRLAVVTSLGNFATEAAAIVPVLTDALKSFSPDLVRAASQTAGKLGAEAEKLVPVMVNALENEDASIRKEVLTVLQKLGPAAKAAAPALAKVLGGKDRDARVAALSVVEALGKDAKVAVPAVILLFGEEAELRNRLMTVLTKVGKDAVPDLINGLSNPHPNVRIGSARTLGAIGKPAKKAAGILAQVATTDTIIQVREACLQAYQSVIRP